MRKCDTIDDISILSRDWDNLDRWDKEDTKQKLRIKAISHKMRFPKKMPWEFDKDEVILGVCWEYEHLPTKEDVEKSRETNAPNESRDPYNAFLIALHHLSEYHDYYSVRMERGFPEEFKEIEDQVERYTDE